MVLKLPELIYGGGIDAKCPVASPRKYDEKIPGICMLGSGRIHGFALRFKTAA